MKTKTAYVCTACKAVSPRWQGQCPKCQAWNTLEPVLARPGSMQDLPGNRPVDLRELPTLFFLVQIDSSEWRVG